MDPIEIAISLQPQPAHECNSGHWKGRGTEFPVIPVAAPASAHTAPASGIHEMVTAPLCPHWVQLCETPCALYPVYPSYPHHRHCEVTS